jgi:hypothetical protein
MTVPHSYNANELMNLAGAVEQAALIKLIHATFDGELSERAQQMIVTALRALASPPSSGPSHEARELLVRALDRMEMYDPHTQVREDIEDYLERSSRSATPSKSATDAFNGDTV